jgi:hypothetical protein
MQFIGAFRVLVCTMIPCDRKAEAEDRDAKGRVQVALGMLVHSEWKDKEALLRLETKPKKAVFALRAYAVGELILVPYSESLVVEEISKANDHARILTDVRGSNGKAVYISKPPINFPKPDAKSQTGQVEIFWCVRDSEKPEKKDAGETPSDPEAKYINMELKTYRVLGAMAIKPESDVAAVDVT